MNKGGIEMGLGGVHFYTYFYLFIYLFFIPIFRCKQNLEKDT